MTAIDWKARWALGGWAEDAKLRRTFFPIGPRNAWSNIAYAVSAIYIVIAGHGDTRWVLGAAMILLAIGSGYYHYVKTEKARTWDWAGMIPTMTIFAVHGMLHNSPGLAFGSFTVATVIGSIYAKEKSDIVLGVLFLAGAVPPLMAGNVIPTAIAVCTFGLAMTFWIADKKHWAMVGLWGHAIWHVLTAVAMPQLYSAQGI
jgi:hypothetical protein